MDRVMSDESINLVRDDLNIVCGHTCASPVLHFCFTCASLVSHLCLVATTTSLRALVKRVCLFACLRVCAPPDVGCSLPCLQQIGLGTAFDWTLRLIGPLLLLLATGLISTVIGMYFRFLLPATADFGSILVRNCKYYIPGT